jgi:hypothetical protein
MLGDRGYIYFASDRCIKDSGTVKVRSQLVAIGESPSTAQVIQRQGDARKGIFQAKKTGDGPMKIVWLNRCRDLIEIKSAIHVIVNRLGLNTGKDGAAAGFVKVGVRAGAGDIFFAALAVGQDRQKISLSSAGDKQPGLVAEHIGHLRFEAID